jgi:hypothetical protein
MCVYICMYIYYNENVQYDPNTDMSAKAMQTTSTIWPVLCDTSQQLG